VVIISSTSLGVECGNVHAKSRKRAENSQPLTLMTSRSVLYCATSYRRLPSFSPQKCSRRWLSELASKSSVPKKTKKAIAAEPVGGPKRGPGRPPKSKAYDSSEKKSEEVLPKVVGWDLPPLDLWRKYFPLDKSSLHRSVIRNPDTAAMLADAFVPEGSKDKIIIDACPGAVLLYSLSGVFLVEPQNGRPWSTYSRTSKVTEGTNTKNNRSRII